MSVCRGRRAPGVVHLPLRPHGGSVPPMAAGVTLR